MKRRKATKGLPLKPKSLNHRMVVSDGSYGSRLRIWQRGQRGKTCPRILVKCGCCDQSLEIYVDQQDGYLEINGVQASQKEWRKLLLPLLGLEKKNP